MCNKKMLAGLLASFAAALILASGAGQVLGQEAAAGTQPAYLNPSLPLDQRVDDLVSRMTMEEKAGQLVNQAANSEFHMRNERILAGLLAWFAAVLILTSGAGPALCQQTAAETQPAYLNPSLPLDQRVEGFRY